MLTHLKLENFKIWKNTGPIRLAPITLLLGTNSSGKSSLIQSLLLIRQTVKSDDPNIDLNLGNPDFNDSVTLGQFKDVLCRHGDSNQFGIEFRWSEARDVTESAIFTARYRWGTGGSAELDYLHLEQKQQGFIVQRRRSGVYSLQLGNELKTRGRSPDFRPQRSFVFSAATVAKLGEDGERIKNIGPATVR